MKKIWVTFEIDLYTREQATFRELRNRVWKEAEATWFMRGGPRYYIKRVGKDPATWFFCHLRSGNKYSVLHALSDSQVKKLRSHSQLQ